VLNEIAQQLRHHWADLYTSLTITAPYSPDATQAGQRTLSNVALMLWLRTTDKAAVIAAQGQYASADNMTNRMAALNGLLSFTDLADVPLADFYTKFANNDLVIDKWFALQATTPNANVKSIIALTQHPAFKWETPNRMRTVVFRLCMANPTVFHCAAGYAFWLVSLEKLIAINPEVAARLARAMDHWQRHDVELATAMKATIQQALNLANLPKGVSEILNKALAIT
jgi:aminopeptidase N